MTRDSFTGRPELFDLIRAKNFLEEPNGNDGNRKVWEKPILRNLEKKKMLLSYLLSANKVFLLYELFAKIQAFCG